MCARDERRNLVNRRVATVVVIILVFAMVGTIAWNEYLGGRWGAGDAGKAGGTGVRESITSTPKPMLANSPSPMPPSTPTPMHPIPPSPTLPLTPASTLTPTPTPTVTLPLMQVASQFGVNLRDAPGGEVIQGLADGTLVQPYPSSEEEVDGIRWLHVATLDGVEGWLAVNNLIHFFSTLTATP